MNLSSIISTCFAKCCLMRAPRAKCPQKKSARRWDGTRWYLVSYHLFYVAPMRRPMTGSITNRRILFGTQFSSQKHLLTMAAAASARRVLAGLSQPRASTGARSMSSTAKVWVDKDTRVICQGFTGKQVSFDCCSISTDGTILFLYSHISTFKFPLV